MSKKATKRIQNKDDYEKSSFKDVIEDMQDTKDKALETLPRIKKNRFEVGRKHQKRYRIATITITITIKMNSLLTFSYSRAVVVICLLQFSCTLYLYSTFTYNGYCNSSFVLSASD